MAKRKPLSRGMWLRRFDAAGEADREALGATLESHEMAALGSWYWQGWARDAQLPPEKAWRTWLIQAGRGFGKTRAGAEWVRDVARHEGNARIALVAATLSEARSVMVEGESGILAASPGALAPLYEPSLKRLTWENGAVAHLYSAAEPDSLRGPQHSHAWCDEIAKWDNVNEKALLAWNNLQLTMRLGDGPRVLATTTPNASALMHKIAGDAKRGKVVIAHGKTTDAKQVLPGAYFGAMIEQFEQSHFGRQELDGEMSGVAEGALWTRDLLEACRVTGAVPEARRTVVAVDPPASAKGDACGIVVAALGVDERVTVLADCSLQRARPEQWARAVARAAGGWDADCVVVEVNQGGDMVTSVLRAAGLTLRVKPVHARKGKAARAEPVATSYAAGKVRHAGLFAKLEDQLCGLLAGGRYEGPGRSPDRADALVYAVTELLGEAKAVPRVRGL